MAVSQELVAKFKADVSDFNRKVKNVQSELEKTGTKAQAAGVKTNQAFSQLKNVLPSTITSFKALSVTIGGAAIALGAFSIKVGSDMEKATKRIESMLGSVEKTNFVIDQLREQANSTGSSIISLTSSFGKLATFVENGSLKLNDAVKIAKGLDNTAVALGASTEQLNQVMYGFSQAMGSGTVRAEEFNQVTEPLPGIINAIEKANDLATGSLRRMINEGQVTSEMFAQMLIPALDSFTEKAQKMSDTLTANYGKMQNTFVAIGEDIYDYINTPLSNALELFDDFLQGFVSVERAVEEELTTRLIDTNEAIFSLKKRLEGLGIGEGELSLGGNRSFGLREDELIQDLRNLENKRQSVLDELNSRAIEREKSRQNKEKKEVGTNKGIVVNLRDILKSSNNGTPKQTISKKKNVAPREGFSNLFEPDAGSYLGVGFTQEQMEQNKSLFDSFFENIENKSLTTGDLMQTVFSNSFENMANSMTDMVAGGKASFKDLAFSMIKDINAVIMRALIMRSILKIGQSLGSSAVSVSAASLNGASSPATNTGFSTFGTAHQFGGFRASGGSVSSGMSYVVGEKGPEILTMGNNGGFVTSNAQSGSMLKGSNAPIINIDARGASAGVGNEIKRAIGQLRNEIPNIAIASVREQNNRSNGFLR